MLKINHVNMSLHCKSKLCHVIIFSPKSEYVYCNTKNKSVPSNKQPSHFLLGVKKNPNKTTGSCMGQERGKERDGETFYQDL